MALAMSLPDQPLLYGPAEPEWNWQPFGVLIARAGLAIGVEAEAFGGAHAGLYLFLTTAAFLLIAYLL